MRGHFPDLKATVPKPLSKQYDPNPTTFGAKLRNKRLELNISFKDFSALLGISEATLFFWESNKVKLRKKNYCKLIEVVGFIF